jgi:hypothetical protein
VKAIPKCHDRKKGTRTDGEVGKAWSPDIKIEFLDMKMGCGSQGRVHEIGLIWKELGKFGKMNGDMGLRCKWGKERCSPRSGPWRDQTHTEHHSTDLGL